MSNSHILSQYLSLNHGPYYSERIPSPIQRRKENLFGITNFQTLVRDKFSPDKIHTNKYFINEKSSSNIISSDNSLTSNDKTCIIMNKYQEIKNKHRVIYCENSESDDGLLKRSLQFIKKISKNNTHLEVLGNHLNSLALCERNLENKRREFKKLVYGLDDGQFEEQELKGDQILVSPGVVKYKYPVECSEGELNKAKDCLYGSKNKEVIIAVNNRSNIELSIGLVQCLRSQQWLNDELINFYFSMLQERNDRQVSKGLKLRVWLWNSFFYTKLTNNQNGGENGYCYKNVSRWTQRKKIDLFEYDLVLLPINVNNVHWTLGVVNFKLGYIQYIDSLGGKFQDHLGCRKMSAIFFQNMSRYIQDEYLDKKKQEFPGRLKHFTNFSEPVPQQNNGSDCGVFTCMFAECLSEGRSFDFDVAQIDRIREVMLVECIRNEIF
ncbi:ULP1 like chllamydin domain-containing protease [Cryptosporidium ubiquitum]|uniref:ULP1 like chllamydin domain-containing protease n=1 Tax=Cryptosporidium ubiquitum TaxID=857276 RepID=A0A1J4MMM3_9CRYT|nr:ULP1 like chllamydin domain-containing protease [Cryptosporidium ubiquitum]OII75446.1 ULP1 like chllamydin domain-containing protease [Cryptosporidium ubiquitum]